MKKQKLVLLVWDFIFFPSSMAYALIFCPLQGCEGKNRSLLLFGSKPRRIRRYNLRNYVTKTVSSVELTYNHSICKQIDYYLKNYKQEIGCWIELSDLDFPIMQRILKVHHISQEMIYLIVIESSLNLSYSSPLGLSGLWQFTSVTGKLYGLEISDWILAITAYNCDVGNVQKVRNYTNYQSRQSLFSRLYTISHYQFHYVNYPVNYMLFVR